MTQSIDIVGSIASIERLAREKAPRTTAVQARDRVFLVDQQSGESQEVFPRFEDVAPKAANTQVRDLASLAVWAEQARNDGWSGQVVIGARSETRALCPMHAAPHEKRVEGKMAFFDAYLPASTWMKYVDFIGWIDLVKPFMAADQAKLIDLALESIEAKSDDSSSLTIRNAGANLQVTSKGEKKATLDGKFPKYVDVTIPFGDPTFRTAVRFAVTMKLEDEEIRVKVTHHPEPATSAWIEWARGLLTAALPGGWAILVGP